MTEKTQGYAGAAMLGLLAGMRTMSAPVLISRVARSGALASPGSKLAFLNSHSAASATALLALGELVADKVPKLPARTKAGPLTARAVSGAFAGAVLCAARKRSPWLGALCGAAGAVAGAFAAQHLRHAIKDGLGVPDAVVAVAEDAVVAGGGWLILAQLRDKALPASA
jgi:uncharacterized membrane protein